MSEESEEKAVLVERRGRIMIITMNRPSARNAINGALSNGVWDAVQELNNDPNLTAGVLTGAGGHVLRFEDLTALSYGKAGYANPFFIAASPSVELKEA